MIGPKVCYPIKEKGKKAVYSLIAYLETAAACCWTRLLAATGVLDSGKRPSLAGEIKPEGVIITESSSAKQKNNCIDT